MRIPACCRCALAIAALAALLAVAVAGGLAAEDALTVVQASEILGKIERGESVDYDRVFIEGDLDIGGGDLETREVERSEIDVRYRGLSESCKVVSRSIKITNSVINGSVDLNNTIFEEEVSFKSTDIRGNSYFEGACFSGLPDFERARFGGNANFRSASFSDDAYFVGSRFSDNADFVWARFGGNAIFVVTSFGGNTYFGGASFGGIANFGGASFGGDASFGGASFGSEAFFSEASFGGDADFDGSTFLGPLDISGSRFGRFEIEWSSLKGGLIADGPAYLALVKNFRELGRYEDADSCYYQYRKWRQDGPEPLWSKITDIVAWLSCGYGVRPSFTLAWCVGLMGIFALLFWLGGGICLTAAWDHEGATPAAWSPSQGFASFKGWLHIFARRQLSRIRGLVQQARGIGARGVARSIPRAILALWRGPIQTQISFTEALYFSILVFVSQPPPHWMPRGRWRYAVMAEDVLGWLLLALLIVTLGNVMIK